MKTKPLTAQQVEDQLAEKSLHYRVSRKGRTYSVKRTFFYTHGCTADKIAAAIRRALPEARIVEAREHWNSWPKDSYWLVRFELEPPVDQTKG